MNSKELFISTVKMEQHAKVPFFPRELTLSMDVDNVSSNDVFTEEYNSRLAAECVLSFQKYMKNDVTVGCVSSYSMECFGGVTKIPKNGVPYISKHPFENCEEMEKHDPSEILSPLVKGFRESCEIVKKKRPDLALAVNVPGPMTMSGFARGVENLMMDLELNKEFCGRLLKFSKKAIELQMLYVSEDIGDAIFFASATDNPDMVGKENYVKYSVNNVKDLVSTIHNNGMLALYHPHGIFSTEDRKDILNEAINTKTDAFQFAEGNNPEGIRRTCTGRCAVMGGVDAFSTLLLGPKERVVRDTEMFLDVFRDESYVAMCSCSVNRGLPLDNLKTMSETIQRYNGGAE